MNGSDWSEEAVDWFRAMVHNKMLYARVYPQGPKVTVELFFEKGKLGAMRYLRVKRGQLNAHRKLITILCVCVCCGSYTAHIVNHTFGAVCILGEAHRCL